MHEDSNMPSGDFDDYYGGDADYGFDDGESGEQAQPDHPEHIKSGHLDEEYLQKEPQMFKTLCDISAASTTVSFILFLMTMYQVVLDPFRKLSMVEILGDGYCFWRCIIAALKLEDTPQFIMEATA